MAAMADCVAAFSVAILPFQMIALAAAQCSERLKVFEVRREIKLNRREGNCSYRNANYLLAAIATRVHFQG